VGPFFFSAAPDHDEIRIPLAALGTESPFRTCAAVADKRKHKTG
jgi:hypothetical protein